MKQHKPEAGLGQLCGLFGKTRQAWYEGLNRQSRELLETEMIKQLVTKVRRGHARMGTRKLYFTVKQDMERMGIHLGRDRFFDVLRELNLLVRRRRRKGPFTTESNHWLHCYSNLIRDLVIDRPEQVWVSDITYLRLDCGGEAGFCYLSLITDAYSRLIVGYRLSHTLQTEGTLEALEQALKGRMYDGALIHHSDRGLQYASRAYVNRLKTAGVAISMNERGSGENAIAERVNGILKDEYLLGETFESFEAAHRQVQQAIKLYNEDRPHLSLGLLTPIQAHQQTGTLKRLWNKSRMERNALVNSFQQKEERTKEEKNLLQLV